MSEEKTYRVYTPNASFTGRRNAGRMSTVFEDGVAEVDEKRAHFFVNNFGYYCPELYPEHLETVKALRPRPEFSDQAAAGGGSDDDSGSGDGNGSEDDSGKGSEDDKSAGGNGSEQDDEEKVTVRFLKKHGIFKKDQVSDVKSDFADKLISEGKAEKVTDESP